MIISDEQIGKNVATARGDMSQKEVARLMRERGWKWSQATVWSVEKGERPLRLAEAEDLANLLKAGFMGFTSPDTVARARRWQHEAAEAAESLGEAALHFHDVQTQYAVALDTAGDEATRIDEVGARSWLERNAVEIVIEALMRNALEGNDNGYFDRFASPEEIAAQEQRDQDLIGRNGHYLNLLNANWKRVVDEDRRLNEQGIQTASLDEIPPGTGKQKQA